MRYEDFTVEIASGETEGRFSAAVLASPAGEEQGWIEVPERWGQWSPGEIRALLEPEIRESSATPSRDLSPASGSPRHGELRARDFGEQLFHCLFAGEVRSLYDISRGRLSPLAGGPPELAGLRIRLHLRPDAPAALDLCSLPWELLWNAGEQGFLALNASRSIVRHFNLPQPAEPMAAGKPSRPLRVLTVLSRPAGTAPLDVGEERSRLVDAFEIQDEVHVTVLERATLPALQKELARGQFHVLHFAGHGAPGGAGLLFETDRGEIQLVSGSQLGSLLQGTGRPSLVFLNACRTACLAENPELTGLSISILQAGIPAVLAMQFPISDSAALLFSGALFRALAHGEEIDAAVSHGRLAIHLANANSLEWATPVLFLRGTASNPLGLAPAGPVLISPEGLPPSPPAPPGAPKKLQVFQRDLYQRLDDLRIASLADYQRLSEPERRLLSREILDRIIGLGTRPEDLLELRHVNARFPSKALLARPDVLASLDVLHRKSAIYSDHSLICMPPVELLDSFDPMAKAPVLGEDTIALLLQHRDLVETGRMCVVPEMVQPRREKFRCLFDVRQLDTTKVDLKDPMVRTFFLEEGELFRPAGVLMIQSSEGGGLHLGNILEIEDRFQTEYRHFQTHLRKTLLSMNPEDETRALKLALQEVDAGIRELDARFESSRRRQGTGALQALATGALAVVLYSVGPEAASFLSAAFAGTSLSALVSFLPDLRQIPEEVRQSPFFVPWLISREGRKSHP